MPPLPSLPGTIDTRLYDEGSYRLNALVAGADVESQCLGHSTLVYFADKDQPKTSHLERQVRTEFKAYTMFGNTFHYECAIVSGGTIEYNGNRGPDYMAVSVGTKFVNNIMEMPQHPSTITKSSVEDLDPANWMRALRQHHPGTTKLSDLTIPGTHNSFARVGTVEKVLVAPLTDFICEFAECQSHTIHSQLLMGIRSIDLRTSGADLLLRHGRVALSGTLPSALATIASFLAAHPDETVLVQAKRDMETITGARSGETPETRKAVEDCFASFPCAYTSTTIPTLDEARGKMVLLASDHATKGITFPPTRDGQPNVNGEYEDLEQHWQDVSRRLEWIASNPVSETDAYWYACGTATYWFPGGANYLEQGEAIRAHGFKSPRDHAMYTNWRLSELVRGRFWGKRTRLGLVDVDFAVPGLVKELVLTNFE